MKASHNCHVSRRWKFKNPGDYEQTRCQVTQGAIWNYKGLYGGEK